MITLAFPAPFRGDAYIIPPNRNSQNLSISQVVGHDTRLNSSPVSGYSVRVDYLTGVGRTRDIQNLINLIESYCEPLVVENSPRTFGQHKFTHLASSINKILLWYYSNEDGGYTYRLQIPGKVCAYLDLIKSARLFRILHQVHALRCTRADIALDLWRKTVIPEMLMECYVNGEYSGFRTPPKVWGSFVNNPVTGTPQYVTTGIQFGRRTSGKTMVVYRTEFVHSHDAIRFELRFYENRAKDFLDKLVCFNPVQAESEESYSLRLAAFLASWIPGEYKFGTCKTDHVDRDMKLHSWWEDLVTAIGEKRSTHVPCNRPTIHSSMNWIQKQVVKRLYCLREAMGADIYGRWLFELFIESKKRLNEYDYALIDMGKETFARLASKVCTKSGVKSDSVCSSSLILPGSDRFSLLCLPNSGSSELLLIPSHGCNLNAWVQSQCMNAVSVYGFRSFFSLRC